MRISNDTRYPHPVLSPFADDYASGEFSVEFVGVEDANSSVLGYEIKLTEPTVRALVESGRADLGCIVRCPDTYYIRLHRFDFPSGKISFQAGEIIDTVTLRPLIWLKQDQPQYSAASVHPEFGESISLQAGDILAMDIEVTISVGKAKLASAESIFELAPSDDVQEGKIAVALGDTRISILVHPETLKTINYLREKPNGPAVVMSSCYFPAVMEVIELLRAEKDSYLDCRWYRAFAARCIFKGVDIHDKSCSILWMAQELLENPLETLKVFIKGDDNE